MKEGIIMSEYRKVVTKADDAFDYDVFFEENPYLLKGEHY